MPRYSGDPYWLNARFHSTCKCGRPIKKGDSIFYYPRQRTAMCDGPNCGAKASAEFNAAAQDEAVYCGQAW